MIAVIRNATDTSRIQSLSPADLVRLTRAAIEERLLRAAAHLQHNGQLVNVDSLAEVCQYEPAYVSRVVTALEARGAWAVV